MTTKEAIAMLRRIQDPEPYEPRLSESAVTALGMGIKALEKPPLIRCEDCKHRPVEYQNEGICPFIRHGASGFYTLIPDDDFYCANWEGRKEMTRPIDPIDIKQAIKDGQLAAFSANGKAYIKDVKSGDCVKILEERENGKWIENPENCQWECSACGNQLSFEPDITPFESGYYFCPNCGAAMVELIMTGETKE